MCSPLLSVAPLNPNDFLVFSLRCSGKLRFDWGETLWRQQVLPPHYSFLSHTAKWEWEGVGKKSDCCNNLLCFLSAINILWIQNIRSFVSSHWFRIPSEANLSLVANKIPILSFLFQQSVLLMSCWLKHRSPLQPPPVSSFWFLDLGPPWPKILDIFPACHHRTQLRMRNTISLSDPSSLSLLLFAFRPSAALSMQKDAPINNWIDLRKMTLFLAIDPSSSGYPCKWPMDWWCNLAIHRVSHPL